MSANNLRYGYPLGVSPLLGNVADTGASLAVGAAVSGYPLTNIANGNPAKPFKCTGTTVQILWDLGSALAVKYFALIHHNLDNALASVSMKAGTTSGVADATAAITIPSADDDGYTVSPWVDLTAIGAKRYWRFNVDVANSVNIIIGECCLQLDDRQVAKNWEFGSDEGEAINDITHRTNAGVELIYERGVRIKSLKGSFDVSSVQLPTYRSWHRVVRRQPHLIIPDATVNEAWLARIDLTELTAKRPTPNRRPFAFAIREVSRGLPWSRL